MEAGKSRHATDHAPDIAAGGAGTDKHAKPADSTTQYNRGVAYREMGLHHDAVAQFLCAANDPMQRLESCGMLGLCFLELGMPRQAILWLKEGLTIPDHCEEDYQELRYRLGLAYQKCRDYVNALAAFEEVARSDPAYHGVMHKIREIESWLGLKPRP